MEQIIIKAIEAALELTKSSGKGESSTILDEQFAAHYAAIIKAVCENPVRLTGKGNLPPAITQGKANRP